MALDSSLKLSFALRLIQLSLFKMSAQHPGSLFVFFHETGYKISGSSVFMCFIKFIDISTKEFDDTLMISQEIFDQILTACSAR